MRNRLPSPTSLPAAKRALGGLLALCVLLLACAAQSPAAHAWLHGTPHEHAHGDAHPHAHPDEAAAETACPVILFAQGLTAPFPLSCPRAPESLVLAITRPPPTASHAAEPPRLHPPAQAPPAVG
jgi:hypothetical protein